MKQQGLGIKALTPFVGTFFAIASLLTPALPTRAGPISYHQEDGLVLPAYHLEYFIGNDKTIYQPGETVHVVFGATNEAP